MDPVTHTLVGFSLAESGLKRRTALGTATLVIGANLPDVDVVSMFWGPETAFWFRRGATHGVLALMVLPVVLTVLVSVWSRTYGRGRGRAKYTGSTGVRPLQVLLLAFVAVASHPLLDFLNVYGMRWLVPFSDTWTYGDTLFIVDPWVWVLLAAGLFRSRRRSETGDLNAAGRASRRAFYAVIAYVAVMALSNVVGRSLVFRAAEDRGFTPARLMVAPVAVNPFRRSIVVQDGSQYRFGTLRWLGRPMVAFNDLTYESRPAHPAAAAAVRGPRPRQFLSWARFPYYQVELSGDFYVVRIADARYAIDPERSWAATEIRVGRARANP